MYSAIGVEPTKLTAATRVSVSRVSTASLSPLTTLKTPAGSPASWSSSARRRLVEGSRSEGLSTKVLPQLMATGNIHIGTIAGKLNGVIPAQTPSGWRIDQLSMPEPICSVNSPLSSCGMPQTNSTTSRPRISSPLASENTLPCSRLIKAAISSACRSTSSLILNMIRARRNGGIPAHCGNAAAAAAIACSVTARLASGTRAATAPVAGSKTSFQRPPFSPGAPGTIVPPMKWPRAVGVSGLVAMLEFKCRSLSLPRADSQSPGRRAES